MTKIVKYIASAIPYLVMAIICMSYGMFEPQEFIGCALLVLPIYLYIRHKNFACAVLFTLHGVALCVRFAINYLICQKYGYSLFVIREISGVCLCVTAIVWLLIVLIHESMIIMTLLNAWDGANENLVPIYHARTIVVSTGTMAILNILIAYIAEGTRDFLLSYLGFIATIVLILVANSMLFKIAVRQRVKELKDNGS